MTKPYLIDDEPVTPRELIARAMPYSETFAQTWLKRTSVAASILREHGHRVENNPEFKK